MSIGDKRSLIESIFNIDILSEMAKEVKKRNTADKSEQRLKIAEMNGYQDRINDNQTNMEKIKTYIEQFESNKQKEIEDIKIEIDKFVEKIEKNIKNIGIGEKKIKELQQEKDCPSEEEFKTLSKSLGIAEHEKNNIIKTLKTIGSNKFCPICGSELDEGHAKEHIDKLKADLNTLENDTIFVLKKQEEDYNAKKEKVKKTEDFINTITENVQKEICNKTSYEKNIEQLNKQIDTIQNRTCDFTIDEYVTKIDELKGNLDNINTLLKNINHKISVDTKLIDILGDEGLRMYFFKKLLPILNQKINYYLQKFELSATLEFDSFMNETIKTGKFEQQYNQFSGGERCRIDMAILLSFFDISKIISNWSCSIMYLDELLDNAVDQNGLEQFISTLYNIVTEENKNLGIYLISHKLGDLQVNWNEVIEIEKKSLFSEIKKRK